MTDFRTLTLKERLDRFPPFLCVALARVKVPTATKAEKRRTLWSRKARLKRQEMKRDGIEIPRRKGWRRITIKELSERSHIGQDTVIRLASRLDWNNVSVFTMLRFMEGCGIDVCRIGKQQRYLNWSTRSGCAFAHLDARQMSRFLALAEKWKSNQKSDGEKHYET